MDRRALFIRQAQEGFADLRKMNRVLLRRGQVEFDHASALGDPRGLGLAAAHAVDERIVDDGQQPGAHVAASTETRAPLIGAHQRVVHEVLRIARIAGERPRIAS